MPCGSFPDVFRLFSTTRCPEDTATVYVRRPRRGCTQPKLVICANASLRYVFRCSEMWDLGQGVQRVYLTEGSSSITGAISYYHTLHEIDG